MRCRPGTRFPPSFKQPGSRICDAPLRAASRAGHKASPYAPPSTSPSSSSSVTRSPPAPTTRGRAWRGSSRACARRRAARDPSGRADRAVENQQTGARQRRHGRGAARAPQHRDLAEEMPDAEPHALVARSSISTSPAAMKYIECAGSPRRTMIAPALDRLGAQQLHDVGDLAAPRARRTAARSPPCPRSRRSRADGSARENAVAMMPTGSATMTRPKKIVTAAISLPSGVTGTTSP